MPVEIRLPTVLRPHAGGLSTVTANGTTIGEVLPTWSPPTRAWTDRS
jgi:hypothetical protein